MRWPPRSPSTTATRCRCTSTRAPATASTTRARSATPPRPPTWPATAPSSCSTGPRPVGETVRLTSPFDGFGFDAYRVRPDDARRGGLLLIQEIFGVTEHIRELCDGYA